MNSKNLAFPIVIIFISIMALFFISQFPTPSYEDSSVSSKFFPSAIAIIQIIICSFIILGEYINRRNKSEDNALFNKYSLFGALFLIAYAALIYVFGYFISTLVAFIIYLFFFKSKNIWYYITALVFTSVVYYVFANVFYVALPEGILMGFNL